MKSASHKRTNAVWYHLSVSTWSSQIHGDRKSRGGQGRGRREWRTYIYRCRALVLQDEKSSGCITMWMHVMSGTVHFKMSKKVNLLCVCHHNGFKIKVLRPSNFKLVAQGQSVMYYVAESKPEVRSFWSWSRLICNTVQYSCPPLVRFESSTNQEIDNTIPGRKDGNINILIIQTFAAD